MIFDAAVVLRLLRIAWFLLMLLIISKGLMIVVKCRDSRSTVPILTANKEAGCAKSVALICRPASLISVRWKVYVVR